MSGSADSSKKNRIVQFISEKGINILNLCHIPEDGRLKTLSFSTFDKQRMLTVLEGGERVDGSSLFSFIEPGKSDIYVMPRTERVFINPFSAIPTLNIMCDYLDENGKPLDVAPKSVLARAEQKLQASSRITLKALAELEYYVISQQDPRQLFPGDPDKNYHESAPFALFEDLRSEILMALSSIGIQTKYAHSEVGRLSKDNILIEQHEVELLPQTLAEMSESIALSKWVIRNVCAKHGISVSFSPKLSPEHAGTGMHIHLCGLRGGKNVVATSDGKLSREAMKMIGGILKMAPSLAAFGNPTPVSYFRLIARKESPMYICWSDRNRLALIRIPLWWSFKKRNKISDCEETFEYRAPDAFASASLLFAGIALAANHGLENPEESLKIAEKLHIETSIGETTKLKSLPQSCSDSAAELEKDRKFYEADGVFPRRVVDKTVGKLRAYQDQNLWKEMLDKPDKAADDLMRKYIHFG